MNPVNRNPGHHLGKVKALLLHAFPFVLTGIVLWPRLVDPQFGLFDDALTLQTARALSRGDWNLWDFGGGRFRPVYWLFYWLVYVIAGPEPLGYFVAEAVLLGISGWLLFQLLRSARLPGYLGVAATAAFIASPPTIETFYTLSKAEHLQTLFALLAVFWAAGASSEEDRWRRCARRAGVTMAVALSTASKETSVVLVPIALGWWLLGQAGERWWDGAANLDARRLLFLGSAVGVGFWVAVRFIVFQSLFPPSGGYGSGYDFAVSRFIDSAIRYTGWLLYFFPYLLPAGLLYLVASIGASGQDGRVADAAMWMAGWVAVYLPWKFAVGYYLLPFAVGAVGFAALGIDHWGAIREKLDPPLRWLGQALCLSVVILWLLTLPTSYSLARVQLAVDKSNAGFLERLSQLPVEATVLVNIQVPNEYTDKMPSYLAEVYGRQDLRIEVAGDEIGEGDTYLARPLVENQPRLTVRLGVVEETQDLWNAEIEPVLDGRAALLFSNVTGARLLSVNFPRTLCWLIPRRAYCRIHEPLLDTRFFRYGWELYRLNPQDDGVGFAPQPVRKRWHMRPQPGSQRANARI